ncbi:hypothetical protein ACFWMR_02265 [Amycolatopsis thailandensis]|uniref:hypothetical protein n=1 Tax=Amycolatopsis thailandensis TaxID=589330 RepID=UPI00365E019C
MSREIRRVPFDFDWPLNKVWHGYLMPRRLVDETPCPANCSNGYSDHAKALRDLWYGHSPFDPATTGSVALTSSTPAVRAFAERNVARSPEYYGQGEDVIVREAARLAELWNSQWSHHLTDEDVAALVRAGRLRDLTDTWTRGEGWKPKIPSVIPTAAEVNEWSLYGLGHDGINESIVVRARCELDGQPVECPACSGHGSLEAFPCQRAEADAWQATPPPNGDGWQMWETVSEGSPVSPVFATAEDLAQWLTTAEGGKNAGPSRRPMTIEQARGFVEAGWAPSFFGNAGGLHDGAAYVGTEAAVGKLFEQDGKS